MSFLSAFVDRWTPRLQARRSKIEKKLSTKFSYGELVGVK